MTEKQAVNKNNNIKKKKKSSLCYNNSVTGNTQTNLQATEETESDSLKATRKVAAGVSAAIAAAGWVSD